MRRFSGNLCLLMAWLVFPVAALGHGVHTSQTSAQAVTVDFTYADGSPVSFEQVEVLPPGEDTPFQVGSTDRLGRCVFRPDRPGTWRVRMFSEDGHGATVQVEVDDHMLVTATGNDRGGQTGKIITGVAVLFGIFGIVTMLTQRRTA